MAKSSISSDMLNLALKQLGASKVNSHISRVTIVKFDINPELTVSYLCHIKEEEKIYLQRIEPYPMRNYRFETVENIISFIEKDVEQFENASKSSNFSMFLDIINANYSVRRDLEELFLLNNVPHSALENILAHEQTNLDFINCVEHITLPNDPGSCPGKEVPYGDAFEMDQDMKFSSNAKELYGEPKDKATANVVANAVRESVREVILELKDEIKADILKELKK